MPPVARRIAKAFRTSAAAGLLHLATAELESRLPPDLAFAREFAGQYLTKLCHTPGLQAGAAAGQIAPDNHKLAALAQAAPPLRGGEYLNADALASWWIELDQWVRNEARVIQADWPNICARRIRSGGRSGE